MKKLMYKYKTLFTIISFGLAFLLVYTIINLYLNNKNITFDSNSKLVNIIEIGYILVVVTMIVNFLNSYLLSREKLIINLSLGKSRKEIYKSYILEMLLLVLITCLLCVGELIITYVIWKNVITFSISSFVEIVSLNLISICFGFVGYLLGIIKKNNILLTVCLILIFIIFLLTRYLFNLKQWFIYGLIYIGVVMITNICLYFICKKKINSIKL